MARETFTPSAPKARPLSETSIRAAMKMHGHRKNDPPIVKGGLDLEALPGIRILMIASQMDGV